MDLYKIVWKKSAQKELFQINPILIPKIFHEIDNLQHNPFPGGYRKLIGTERAYRIRVGDYRIIYSVYKKILTIEIVRIKHRKDVYK